MQQSAGAINSKEVIDTGINAYIFDVLMINGRSEMNTTLEHRIAALHEILGYMNIPHLVEVPYVYGTEAKYILLQNVMERGGEGIMLKNLDAIYEQDARHENNWYKVKKHDTWDVIIMGYTGSEKFYTGKELDSWGFWIRTSDDVRLQGNYSGQDGYLPVTKFYYYNWIGAIRFGMFRNGELIELGQTSGISEQIRMTLTIYGEKYIGTVMEIEAMEQLPSGAFRHPRFIRFRDDKRPMECIWEDSNES
jgi:ATP-dependent DNA ligase